MEPRPESFASMQSESERRPIFLARNRTSAARNVGSETCFHCYVQVYFSSEISENHFSEPLSTGAITNTERFELGRASGP